MDIEATFHASLQEDEQQIHVVSWETLGALIALLAKKIHADGSPEIIVGLQRGGLIPAVMLSHLLETPTFLSVTVRSTTSDAIYASKQTPVVVSHDLFTLIAGQDILVVDDVVGSGATFSAVLQLLREYKPARIRCVTCIVNREHWDEVNQHEPGETFHYIGQELSGWVVFPWERSIAVP